MAERRLVGGICLAYLRSQLFTPIKSRSHPWIVPTYCFIMTDEHAPMYSGPYGHPLVQTPFMDQLAAEGATFA